MLQQLDPLSDLRAMAGVSRALFGQTVEAIQGSWFRLQAGPQREGPLHRVAHRGRVQAARLLLEVLGPDRAGVGGLDRCGQSPLHHASALGNLEICRLLLQCTADVNQQDIWRSTPLHRVAAQAQDFSQALAIATELLNCGALTDVRVRSHLRGMEEHVQAGDTPLHVAARVGNLLLCQELVKRGAPLHATNRAGESLLDVAIKGSIAEDLGSYLVALGCQQSCGESQDVKARANDTSSRGWSHAACSDRPVF